MTNSEDPEAIKKAEKRYIDMLEDIGYIMKEPRGRRWIYETIFNTCHAGRISHVSGDSDDTAFNEGARSVGLNILDEVRSHNPNNYIKMLQENEFHG